MNKLFGYSSAHFGVPESGNCSQLTNPFKNIWNRKHIKNTLYGVPW